MPRESLVDVYKKVAAGVGQEAPSQDVTGSDLDVSATAEPTSDEVSHDAGPEPDVADTQATVDQEVGDSFQLPTWGGQQATPEAIDKWTKSAHKALNKKFMEVADIKKQLAAQLNGGSQDRQKAQAFDLLLNSKDPSSLLSAVRVQFGIEQPGAEPPPPKDYGFEEKTHKSVQEMIRDEIRAALNSDRASRSDFENEVKSLKTERQNREIEQVLGRYGIKGDAETNQKVAAALNMNVPVENAVFLLYGPTIAQKLQKAQARINGAQDQNGGVTLLSEPGRAGAAANGNIPSKKKGNTLEDVVKWLAAKNGQRIS